MRPRLPLPAAALAAVLAVPACAQIFGIEELPEGTGGHHDAGTGSSVTGGAMMADASDAADAAETWTPGMCDCPATNDWTKAFAASGDVTVAGVAIDAMGRVIVAGSVAGTLDVAGKMLPGGADHDVFVLVLDTCGEPIWARRFGGPGEQSALALALDPGPGSSPPDAIVISGKFEVGLAFGGSAAPLSAPNQRAFVARLDPATGDGIASLGVGSDPSQSYEGTAVAVAPDGTTFWAGTEDSGAHLFLRRLDPALSVKSQITPACDHCDPRLALVPGAAVVAGSLSGSVDFVPGGPGPLDSNGSTDLYVAVLAPMAASFVEDKPKVFGDGKAQGALGVAADSATGEIFVAGSFAGTLNMGGGGKTKTSSGALDAFVAKFDPSLAPQWLATFGGGGLTADQRAVAVAKGQHLAVVGDFFEALDLGADAGSHPSAGDADAFLLVLDPASGAVQSVATFGGPGADHAAAVALDGSTHAVVAGTLGGPADFGCSTLGGPGPSIFVARRTIP
ncbi:MAG: hypothetical protein QM820_46075 [Minicystis sp.]